MKKHLRQNTKILWVSKPGGTAILPVIFVLPSSRPRVPVQCRHATADSLVSKASRSCTPRLLEVSQETSKPTRPKDTWWRRAADGMPAGRCSERIVVDINCHVLSCRYPNIIYIISSYIILYHIISYYIILYYTILYHIISYHILLYYIILYYIKYIYSSYLLYIYINFQRHQHLHIPWGNSNHQRFPWRLSLSTQWLDRDPPSVWRRCLQHIGAPGHRRVPGGSHGTRAPRAQHPGSFSPGTTTKS